MTPLFRLRTPSGCVSLAWVAQAVNAVSLDDEDASLNGIIECERDGLLRGHRELCVEHDGGRASVSAHTRTTSIRVRRRSRRLARERPSASPRNVPKHDVSRRFRSASVSVRFGTFRNVATRFRDLPRTLSGERRQGLGPEPATSPGQCELRRQARVRAVSPRTQRHGIFSSIVHVHELLIVSSSSCGRVSMGSETKR